MGGDNKVMFSSRVNSLTLRLFKASALLEGVTQEEAIEQAMNEWSQSPKRKLPVGEVFKKEEN